MEAVVASALVLGFFGSFHCIGMCGPIAISLPGSKLAFSYLVERLLYNLGRVVTYALLGALFGLLGSVVSLAGLQGPLSIVLGSLIILSAMVPATVRQKLSYIAPIDRLLSGLKRALAGAMKSRSYGTMFLTGMLNGLLPCGFVYVALAGAISTGSVLSSATFMALFGLGTFPAMLAISLGPRLFSMELRRTIQQWMPKLAVMVGILLIIRGLGLGIPFLSPDLTQTGMTHH